ncbi:integrator complex subunit 7-like protein [Leptotrombidium deliense]|uniref:Integrator complex subunit 7 n=1 Tax=Leptotrombidium deliense TaxID=299467 RepID=A0A443SWJ5_9ACAR|nr:integrator complex subunit 7-like protein [Leptotrombidium deliense]
MDEGHVDANSLLSELDKGLRSNRMGDECEAIVRFPWLFTRYPFPILINSASLKLAEVFRSGSNFSRLLILKVIQESEKHLDKILNVDEFVRRIFSVTYSNDPVARAITYRALGSIALIVAERKNIHHSIRNSLDSLDEVEASAAIEAAAKFAKMSADFAVNIYPKVLTMICLNSTPLETKINLLTVLHHSHYNTSTAIEVRRQLIQFLSESTSENFVCALLHTLTYISSSSLMQIPQQIDLLLSYFNKDERRSVKISALKEMQVLAKTTHVWTKRNVKSLLDCVNHSSKYNCLFGVISILVELVKCPCLLADEGDYLDEFETKVVKFCFDEISGGKFTNHLLPVCFELLTELSLRSTKMLDETVDTFKKFVIHSKIINDETLSKHEAEYKKICKCIVTLCNSNEQAAEVITTSLRGIVICETVSLKWKGLVCETLCAIKHRNTDIEFVETLEVLLTNFHETDYNEDILIKLFTLYFQVSNRLETECNLNFVENLNGTTNWLCYRLIRQAMRYGHHLPSSAMCDKLLTAASSENIHFWILCLSKMCRAESLLRNCRDETDMELKMKTAVSLYIESISALKAGVTPTNPLTFTCEYTRLRCKFLQTHILLRQACKLFRTSPAPAIASSAALGTRDDLLKCGLIVTQMRKCAKEFRNLAEGYSVFYQSSFNADNETLTHLQLLQHSCTIFAEAIEAVFQANRLSGLFVNKDTHLESNRLDFSLVTPPEHSKLVNVCHQISTTVREKLNFKICDSVIGANQISTLLSMSRQLVDIPLCVPRLFFQSLQSTCIKLAISPQPKSQDFIITNSNTNFTLKVEGVVVNCAGRALIRKVSKVVITVSTCILSKQPNNEQHLKQPNDSGIQLTSLVEPHNDYFQEQFLLPLLSQGLYSLNVEASIIDENEAQWNSGPIVSISAKVIDESSLK